MIHIYSYMNRYTDYHMQTHTHTQTHTHKHTHTIHVHLCEHIHTNTRTNTYIRALSLSPSFSRRLFPIYNVQAGGEYRKTPASLSKAVAASAIIMALVSFALS